MNTVFKNLLKAIGIMAYFIVLNFAYTRMSVDRLMNDIEVFAGIFLVLGLVMLERAYKKDSGKMALSGIELLCLSMHSLSINHVITFYQYDFRFYLLSSSYVFAIYYVLKSIIIYTREKRQYLRNLSDISEIVKEEPIKKEAKKRRKVRNNKQKVEEINKDTSKKNEEKVKEENKTKNKTKKKANKESSQKEKEEKEVKQEDKKHAKKKATKKESKKEESNKEKKEENKKENKRKTKKKKEVVDND